MDAPHHVKIRDSLGPLARTNDAYIRSLSLPSFVYILTGALVFLACIYPLVKFVTSVRRHLIYHAVDGEDSKDEVPNFRSSPGRHGPVYLETLARSAMEENPMQSIDYTPPPIHNLPLPDGDLIVVKPDERPDVVQIEDLYEVQELFAEKKLVETKIQNLKRVVSTGDVTSHAAAMMRLQNAENRRGELVEAVERSLQKLRDYKASWTDEEWSLIGRITEAYGRRL